MIWVEIGWVGNRAACAAVNQRSRPPGVSSKGLRVGLRRQPAELRVRSPFVVVTPPGLEHRARVRQGSKQRLVQQLVTQAPVEALIEAVLLGLARRDVMPADAGVVGPRQDGVRGVFRAVVADDGVGSAPLPDDGVQLPRDPRTRQRGVGHQRQAFAGAVIDHRQDAEAPSVRHLVRDEVQRPALVGHQRQVQRSPPAHCSLPRTVSRSSR